MAKVRFSHLDDFVLKDDGKVGIGTSLPSARVEVIGTIRAANLKSSSGITTIASLDGYMNQEMEYSDSVTIDSGDSGTLSGEVIIGAGLTMTVGTGVTTGQGRIDSLKVSNTFTPPIGGTNERPSAPQPGALYYNKDFRTIEYWDGNFWRQVDNTTTSTRGLVIGGYQPGTTHQRVETFNISTRGNATFFGTPAMTNAYETAGFGSKTRAFNATDGSYTQQIDYFILASQSNGIDFGNLTGTYGYGSACSSQTRGIVHAGYGHPSPGANLATLDYIEMATVGNAIGFGDLTRINNTVAGFASPTRGIFAGGSGSPAPTTTVDTVIIASKASAIDWGEISYFYGSKGASNTVRGILSNQGGLESYQISTGGNSVDFGHRSRDAHQDNCCASSTRVVMAGGSDTSGGGNVFLNTIEYVTIATLGNAEDFGDLSEVTRSGAGGSDSHGGLGGF